MLSLHILKKKLLDSALTSLDRLWKKEGFEMEIKNNELVVAIDKIFHLKHFNKIKHFMIRLLQRNLYFRNATSHWSDQSNRCIAL